MGQYMNGNGGARILRSQSQNDLDEQAHDGRFYNPAVLRSSSSGYNIQRSDLQHRESDNKLRRHPSDVGEQYRRSFGELDSARVPSTDGDVSRTYAAERGHLPSNQKLRSPSDPSRNLESSQHQEARDYDGQRLRSAGDEFRRSHENMADSAAANKKPPARNENPKNQDILNWLKSGSDGDSQPRGSDRNQDSRDLNRSASNYRGSVNDGTGDKIDSRPGYGAEPGYLAPLSASRSQPVRRNDGEFIAGRRTGVQNSPPTGPRIDKEDAVFSQFGVSNPMYDSSHRVAGGEQTSVSDSSARDRDRSGLHQMHSQPDTRGFRAFSDEGHLPSSELPNQSFQGHGYGYQQAAAFRMPPPKPVHTIFPNFSATPKSDQSDDMPPSLPPKLANQQVPPKFPHTSASPVNQYPHLAEIPPRSLSAEHQLQVTKDDQMDLAPQYAVVQKRPVQSITPVDDSSWHDNIGKPERPRADGAGYPSDPVPRSRQPPDGTLDVSSPSSGITSFTLQPPMVSVGSSSEFGKDQQPGMKASSQENLASSPPGRPPLPLDAVLAPTGIAENSPAAPARSEPQGGAENTNLQVSVFSGHRLC